MIYLNIGLEGAPAEQATISIIRAMLGGMNVKSIEKQPSATEDTLVVELYADIPPGLIHRLATTLSQEAIAYWNDDVEQGLLIGPKCAGWGAFDPRAFVMSGGHRLNEWLDDIRMMKA